MEFDEIFELFDKTINEEEFALEVRNYFGSDLLFKEVSVIIQKHPKIVFASYPNLVEKMSLIILRLEPFTLAKLISEFPSSIRKNLEQIMEDYGQYNFTGKQSHLNVEYNNQRNIKIQEQINFIDNLNKFYLLGNYINLFIDTRKCIAVAFEEIKFQLAKLKDEFVSLMSNPAQSKEESTKEISSNFQKFIEAEKVTTKELLPESSFSGLKPVNQWKTPEIAKVLFELFPQKKGYTLAKKYHAVLNVKPGTLKRQIQRAYPDSKEPLADMESMNLEIAKTEMRKFLEANNLWGQMP